MRPPTSYEGTSVIAVFLACNPAQPLIRYLAVKIDIDNWRWGVPIYIRAGKGLPVTAAEVNVELKWSPRETFR